MSYNDRIMGTITILIRRDFRLSTFISELGIHPCMDDEWIDDMEQRHGTDLFLFMAANLFGPLFEFVPFFYFSFRFYSDDFVNIHLFIFYHHAASHRKHT